MLVNALRVAGGESAPHYGSRSAPRVRSARELVAACARTVAPGDASASELLYEAFRGDFDVAAHLGMAYVTFSVRAEVITDLGQEGEWHDGGAA